MNTTSLVATNVFGGWMVSPNLTIVSSMDLMQMICSSMVVWYNNISSIYDTTSFRPGVNCIMSLVNMLGAETRPKTLLIVVYRWRKCRIMFRSRVHLYLPIPATQIWIWWKIELLLNLGTYPPDSALGPVATMSPGWASYNQRTTLEFRLSLNTEWWEKGMLSPSAQLFPCSTVI